MKNMTHRTFPPALHAFAAAVILAFSIASLALPARAADDDGAPRDTKYVPPSFLGTVNMARTGEVLFAVGREFRSRPSLFDDQVRSVLISLLNHPDTISVEFFSPQVSDDRSSVSYSTVSVALAGASFDNLRVDTASIVLTGISLETLRLFREGRMKVLAQGAVHMDLSILEKDLNSYLVKKSEKIKVRNPFARFERGELVIGGVFKQGIFVIDFTASGVFKVVDGGVRVNFDMRRMSINNMKMSRGFIRVVVDRINPIIDFERFPFKLYMRSITPESGSLRFSSH